MSSLLKTDSLLMDPDFSHIVKDNSQQLSFSPSLKYPSLNQHPIYVSLNNNNITSVSSFPYSNRLFALLCFMEKLFKNLFLSTVSKLPTISTNFHILKFSLFISHLSATCYTLDHFFFFWVGFILVSNKPHFLGSLKHFFSGFWTQKTLKEIHLSWTHLQLPVYYI